MLAIDILSDLQASESHYEYGGLLEILGDLMSVSVTIDNESH